MTNWSLNSELNKEIHLLIVPPPSGVSERQYRAQSIPAIERIAYSCGFLRVRQLLLKEETVVEGALKLKRVLQRSQREGKKVVIVSFGEGSAYVRYCMDQAPDIHQFVKGWLNLSGLIFGSPFYNCSNRKRLFVKQQKQKW